MCQLSKSLDFCPSCGLKSFQLSKSERDESSYYCSGCGLLWTFVSQMIEEVCFTQITYFLNEKNRLIWTRVRTDDDFDEEMFFIDEEPIDEEPWRDVLERRGERLGTT